MNRIEDMLGSSKVELLNECATFIQMANVMKCSVDKVRQLVYKYGSGYIYTEKLVMPDTPRMRAKLTNAYGKVAIILRNGLVIIRDTGCTGMVGRKIDAKKRKRERSQAIREAELRQKNRATERMFSDCQGQPSPKRGGKCQGVPCVYHPANNRDRHEPKAQDVFRTIRVNF